MDKSLEKSLTKWLKSQQSSCGYFLKLATLLGVLNGIAIVGQAYCIANILHGVIMVQQTPAQLMEFFIGLAVMLAARSVIAYWRERFSFEAGRRLREDIRAAVMNKLVKLGPAFIKGKPAGAWASIVLEQVEDLHDFYSKYLPQMILAGFIPLLILVVVFPLNWAAGLVLLATAPLIPLFMILVGMGAADANRKNFTALSRLSGHFMDRIQGLSTLKLFNRAEAEIKQIHQASEDFRSRTMSVLRLAFLSSAVLEFFAALSIAVLAVYFGFSYLHHLDFGHYGLGISLFTGMFVLILAPEFYQPLRDLGTHYHAKAQAIGAAESLVELLEYPEPDNDAAQNSTKNSAIDLSAVSIKAIDFTVMTRSGTCLLGPISFDIKAGQHVAIVGTSGAGKTSLIQALLGFLPFKGELLINGQAFESIDIAYWRQHLAWLGQDPQLFHGTFAENVALGNPQMSEQQMMDLLQQAQIADFVSQHPQGLNGMISDQSAGISVGQAQRIALARALGQQASIYILDEPTASLDEQSANAVMQSLSQAAMGKTAIMVTHKTDELTHADNILVIDKGQLIEQGRYAELVSANGHFCQLLQKEVR
ncbi:heme ABC transporter permease/ATP-binding protein CydD [Shewanella gaetbuli]|uniref:Cysteine/glutathione ABC transporter permease/ATP-binding protein CydD n=1 Tax=Shewanella gaetbuli TaxID=220752 RepID=A0A9X1ZKM2_9GAMM|nr:cysteine/glutathione ABC transporter permease/ATP-binding protein CydD [Shewanella gaetbuli]MCL1141220.1 cysteine/glutathione ABC transporter permease/ATP-binding protein CydD [Shewanella gaetbuli]